MIHEIVDIFIFSKIDILRTFIHIHNIWMKEDLKRGPDSKEEDY